MARLKNPSTIEVHQGLFLKRKDIEAVWQCYFKLNNTQFRKSTKEVDLANAKMIALGWYQEAKQKTVTGKSITKISFQKLARTYLEHIKTLGKHKFHNEIMNRHFLPFFSKFDDISKLRTADIQDYMTYRRKKSSVLPQSINRENTVLRQALYFAEKREWLPNLVHIEHLNERLTRKRRSHFTTEEYLNLCHTAIRRINELEGIPLQTAAYRQRQLLFDYIKQ
jgi:hypothetical protein